MLWEELTARQFEEAAKQYEVCVLPIGVLEKHGNHLPLGTDMMIVNAVCQTAAKVEPTIVFPYYFFGQIAEAMHYPGTIAVSHRLMMDSLLAMCDEISRNGIKKIMIISGHGGNGHFLPFFAQEMPRLGRDYQVYTGTAYNLTPEQNKKINETTKIGSNDFHAGTLETSILMHVRGDLVNIPAQTPGEGKSLDRLKETQAHNLFTGFNWYANQPYHFAGDHTHATPELGSMVFDFMVENVVKDIKAVKADDESLPLVQQYAKYAQVPSADLRHSK